MKNKNQKPNREGEEEREPVKAKSLRFGEISAAAGSNPKADEAEGSTSQNEKRPGDTKGVTPVPRVGAVVQQPLPNAWSLHPCVVQMDQVKSMVDDLHKFVDAKHNVHRGVKELVVKIQAAVGGVSRDLKKELQRAGKAAAEPARAVQEKATAPRVFKFGQEPREEDLEAQVSAFEYLGSFLREGQASGWGVEEKERAKAKTKPKQVSTPSRSAPKRMRSSPGTERPGSAKRRAIRSKRVRLQPAEPTAPPAPAATSREAPEAPWTKVINRRAAKARPREVPPRPNKGKSRTKTSATYREKRGEAVVVKTTEDKYAAILKEIRVNPRLKQLGDDIHRIRRTQAGELLFELTKESKNSSKYKELVEEVCGEGVRARALSHETTIDCRDLDEITTEQEVRSALQVQCGLTGVEIKVYLRKGPSGTQVAAIRLPAEAANKALQAGKMRVGCSVCPLRPSRPDQCYRCLETGHLARYCKGKDRTKMCRRCGEEGHKALDCKSPRKCLLCADKKHNDHATGGPSCPVAKKGRVPAK